MNNMKLDGPDLHDGQYGFHYYLLSSLFRILKFDHPLQFDIRLLPKYPKYGNFHTINVRK